MSRWGEGRKVKGEQALSRQVFARLTPAQHEAFRAVGGVLWLRTQLDAGIERQRLAPTPTAHNPFPPTVRDTGPDEDLTAYERYHGI